MKAQAIQSRLIASVALLALLMISLVPQMVGAAGPWSQGFETDTDGWNAYGGTTTRVASGTDGIDSYEGDYHAVIDGSVFTRWGGYESEFPEGGYTTEVAVYLDMDEAASSADKRIDFSSAISNPAGDHRRDFIFHVGTNPNVDGEWAASVSNNAPGWPLNPGRSPVAITETGWYLLRSTFAAGAGDVLEVTMEVLDADENVVGSWVLSDPSDIVGDTVGGNRYGWFVNVGVDSLAIDAAMKDQEVPFERSAEITAPAAGSEVSGMVDFAAILNDKDGDDSLQWAVRAGTCAAGTNAVAGNVDGFSSDYDWDGATFSATVDMSALPAGPYCFVFNPTESAGDTPIRLTQSFDLVVSNPVTKNECKQGGYMDFGFKNQGQCVRYVETGKDSR